MDLVGLNRATLPSHVSALSAIHHLALDLITDEDKHESTSAKAAGQKVAEPKGRIERVRDAKMAAGRRKSGKNDALNHPQVKRFATEIARRPEDRTSWS